jgi:Tfp pilus assembly protein PilF
MGSVNSLYTASYLQKTNNFIHLEKKMKIKPIWFGLLLLLFLQACTTTQTAAPPPNARDYFQQGLAAFDQADYHYAADSFIQAIRIDPNFANAHFELARTYERMRLDDKAIRAYKNCLEIRPSHGRAHTNIARLYIKKRQYRLAENHLKQAIDYDSGNPMSHYLLAEIYNKQGQCESPIRLYKKALSMQADLVDAQRGLRQVKRNNCHKIAKPVRYETETEIRGGAKALSPSEW